MGDKANSPSEAVPLTREEFEERKRLVSRRDRITTVLLSLCLVLHCGKEMSGRIIEEPAKVPTEEKQKDFAEECASENGENGAKEFLGTWNRRVSQWQNDTISIIKKDLRPKPMETILLDGKEAKLCLSVYVTNIPYDPIGGIYQWDDKFCIVLWCTATNRNVIIPIRKKEGVIQLGVSKRYQDIPIRQDFYPHWEVDHHYSPEIWLDYRQPANRKEQ